MSRDPHALDRHPAPQSEDVSSGRIAFMLLTGPLAWYIQLCAAVPLTSWPCYPDLDRRRAPLEGFGWTGTAALVVLLLGAVLAAAAALVSWRALQQVKEEEQGGHRHLVETGHGRTRFVALWGTILGVFFAVATLSTLVAFLLVPRCAG